MIQIPKKIKMKLALCIVWYIFFSSDFIVDHIVRALVISIPPFSHSSFSPCPSRSHISHSSSSCKYHSPPIYALCLLFGEVMSPHHSLSFSLSISPPPPLHPGSPLIWSRSHPGSFFPSSSLLYRQAAFFPLSKNGIWISLQIATH